MGREEEDAPCCGMGMEVCQETSEKAFPEAGGRFVAEGLTLIVAEGSLIPEVPLGPPCGLGGVKAAGPHRAVQAGPRGPCVLWIRSLSHS